VGAQRLPGGRGQLGEPGGRLAPPGDLAGRDEPQPGVGTVLGRVGELLGVQPDQRGAVPRLVLGEQRGEFGGELLVVGSVGELEAAGVGWLE